MLQLIIIKNNNSIWNSLFNFRQNRFEKRKVIRDKEGHCVMIKESILQVKTELFHVYVPNKKAPRHRRQKLTDLKGNIDKSTIIETRNPLC